VAVAGRAGRSRRGSPHVRPATSEYGPRPDVPEAKPSIDLRTVLPHVCFAAFLELEPIGFRALLSTSSSVMAHVRAPLRRGSQVLNATKAPEDQLTGAFVHGRLPRPMGRVLATALIAGAIR
jgi:hypothetical protein